MSTKGRRFTLLSWIINFLIGGVASYAIITGEIETTYGIAKIPLLFVIAFVWSYTSRLGAAIYKLLTPQMDYLTRPKISHILAEWLLTLIISVGGYLTIALLITDQFTKF